MKSIDQTTLMASGTVSTLGFSLAERFLGLIGKFFGVHLLQAPILFIEFFMRLTMEASMPPYSLRHL
jgi:hypothetical protein